MLKENSNPADPIRHEMPLTHFWLSFGTSMTRRNSELAEYMAKRLDDDVSCALEVAGSKDPASAFARLASNRQRAFADTAALMSSMMRLPTEISSEVADLVDEESKLLKDKDNKVFDEVPV